MLLMNKKKAAASILDGAEKHKMAEGGAASAEGTDDAFTGLHAASEDMISAIHNRSAQDFHRAMSSYLDLKKQEESGKDDADEGASEEPKAMESSMEHYNKG